MPGTRKGLYYSYHIDISIIGIQQNSPRHNKNNTRNSSTRYKANHAKETCGEMALGELKTKTQNPPTQNPQACHSHHLSSVAFVLFWADLRLLRHCTRGLSIPKSLPPRSLVRHLLLQEGLKSLFLDIQMAQKSGLEHGFQKVECEDKMLISASPSTVWLKESWKAARS